MSAWWVLYLALQRLARVYHQCQSQRVESDRDRSTESVDKIAERTLTQAMPPRPWPTPC